MEVWAPSPSPIGLFLLELDARGASGAVDIGERTLVVRHGRVLEVRPATGDPSFLEFLRQIGRIDDGQAAALRTGDPDRLPGLSEVLSAEALAESMRALWLDRLVRGMAQAEASGMALPVLHPEELSGAPTFETALWPLVLDALERRAQEGDAEQVGARATHVLEWLDRPHVARARRWAGLEDKSDMRIASLLGAAPSLPSKLAALVRAGLARIVPPQGSLPAPAHPIRTVLPSAAASEGRPSSPSLLPAARPPAVQLSPGAAQAFADVVLEATPLPVLPVEPVTFSDPLEGVERRIAALEKSGAPAAARAAAWREAALLWAERYASVEEKARALREAAAAQPDDSAILFETADACASVAQPELALAYARAAVAAAPPEGRDDALIALGLLGRRTGALGAALSALRAACSGPRADDAHLLAARVLIALGRRDEAADELLDAVRGLAESERERADYLAWAAFWLAPGEPRTTDALAAALTGAGRSLSALAVQAEAARRSTDREFARNQLLGAAERAELAGRSLLAADFLLRLLDEEPELEVLYEPLDVDLDAAGALLERAVVLEELAVVCPRETRAQWLARAADARLGVPGDGSWELELRIRCLELEPQNEGALQAVRRHAEQMGDPGLVADALERVLRSPAWTSAPAPEAARRRVLEEIARAADAAGEPLRAAWARSVWARSAGAPTSARDPLGPAGRAAMQRAEELERMTREGSEGDRRRATLELARILAQDPERRDRAIALLSAHIDQAWDDVAADLLERIFAVRGDVGALLTHLERRIAHDDRRIDRARRLLRIASIEAMRENFRAAARACVRLLDEIPGHREALIRLRRAASRLRDDAWVREALAREARLKLPPAERSRLLTLLALRLEAAGEHAAARDAVVTALDTDPEAAEAALILCRLLAAGQSAPPEAIARATLLLGDAPPLLAASIRSAGDAAARDAARRRWSRLDPFSPEPWCAAVEAAMAAGDADAAIDAALALADDPCAEAASVRDVARVLEVTAERATPRAAEAAIRCADRFGAAGAELRVLARTLAARAGARELEIAALERTLAGAEPETAVSVLRAIAAAHRARGDGAGEVRAWLRVLARASRDGAAIERLAAIYAGAGEHERMMAALALRVGEGASDDEKLEGWIALAAASARVLGDLGAAESFVRSAFEGARPVEDEAGFARVARVAGVLLTLGRIDAAVDIFRSEAARAGAAWAGRLAERAAALALRATGDVERALALCVEGLMAAPGYGPLLVAFEQLALERKDVALAERTYRGLAERAMGPHGRRAVLYRRARWLERAGAAHAALEAYLEAARHAASPGVILSAIERLARETGDLDALARGLAILAENAPHPSLRVEMIRRAVGVLDHELGKPERAWELLFPLWSETGLAELEEELGRLGARLLERAPEHGERALGELFAELARRAGEAWMGDEKARLLMKAARLHARVRGDVARAEALAREALAALRAESDVAASKVADVLAELAQWLRRDPGRLADARRCAQEALAADPESELARAVAAELGIEAPAARLVDAAEPAPAGESTLAPELVADAPACDVPAAGTAAPLDVTASARAGVVSAPSAPAAESEEVEAETIGRPESDRPTRMDAWFPVSAPPAPSPPRALSEPIAMPLPDAMALTAPGDSAERFEARARALADDPATGAEAAALFRAALVIDPCRSSALEGLARVAAHAGAQVEATIAQGVLAVLDPRRRAARALAVDAAALADARDALLRDPAYAIARRLLAAIWESALPLFRVALPQLGLLGTDRVGPHSATPVGRALAAALAASAEAEVTVYASRAPGVLAAPVRTHPPAVVVGAAAPDDEPSLCFLLGRALELARPDHVLIATLDEPKGRTLVAAVRAAFGPADGAPVSREAAALAAELWHTIPARRQRDIRELVLQAEGTFDYDALRVSIHGGAARAGLLASGDVAASIRALCLVEPELATLRIEDQRSFVEAVGRSSALAALLRFAWSDAFVKAASLR